MKFKDHARRILVEREDLRKVIDMVLLQDILRRDERFEVEMAAANVLAAWRVIIASDAGCEDTRDTFSEVSRVVFWLLF